MHLRSISRRPRSPLATAFLLLVTTFLLVTAAVLAASGSVARAGAAVVPWAGAPEAVPPPLDGAGPGNIASLDCVVGGCAMAGLHFDDFGGLGASAADRPTDGPVVTQFVSLPAGTQASPTAAEFLSVSCASSAFCVAGGDAATVAPDGNRAILASRIDGAWQQGSYLTFAPGVESASPSSRVSAVSCAAIGECAAVGDFVDVAGDVRAFLVTMTGGAWGIAAPVEFPAGVVDDPEVSATLFVSCPTVGECLASGDVVTTTNGTETFVVAQHDGIWGMAQLVPFDDGLLAADRTSEPTAMSCVPGWCAVIGRATRADSERITTAVAVVDGVVQSGGPIDVTGSGVDATSVTRPSVSCTAPGSCRLVGYVIGPTIALTAEMRAGVWGPVRQLDWSALSPAPKGTRLESISCTAPDECMAVGAVSIGDAPSSTPVVRFVTAGVWSAPQVIDMSGVDGGHSPVWVQELLSSCASDGTCLIEGWVGIEGGSREFVVPVRIGAVPGPTPEPEPVSPVVPAFTG